MTSDQNRLVLAILGIILLVWGIWGICSHRAEKYGHPPKCCCKMCIAPRWGCRVMDKTVSDCQRAPYGTCVSDQPCRY